MNFPLANADAADHDATNVFLVALCLATLVVVGVLLGVLLLVARKRHSGATSRVTPVAAAWGFAAIASGVYTVMIRLKWANAHAVEMMSGFGDPNDAAPPLPWAIWSALGVAYAFLMACALWERKAVSDVQHRRRQ